MLMSYSSLLSLLIYALRQIAVIRSVTIFHILTSSICVFQFFALPRSLFHSFSSFLRNLSCTVFFYFGFFSISFFCLFSISQHFTFHLLKYLGKSPSISTIGTRVCSQLWFSQSYILFATQFFARTLQNEMLSIPINPNCSTVNRIIK